MTLSTTQAPSTSTLEIAGGSGESHRTMLTPGAALHLVVSAVALSVLACIGLVLLRPTATPPGSPVTSTVMGSSAGVPELTHSGADWLLQTDDVSCMVTVQPGDSGLVLTPLPPVSGACASAVAALR